MLVPCDCGNDTFKINFWPPNNAEAICTSCGQKQGIAGSDTSDIDPEAIIEESGEQILLKEKPWIRVHEKGNEGHTERIELTERGWEDMKEFLEEEGE